MLAMPVYLDLQEIFALAFNYNLSIKIGTFN